MSGDERGITPLGAGEPLGAIPEPDLNEQAAIALFDRTVDKRYRGMLDAEIEETET